MLKRVQNYIENHQLLTKNTPVIVGVSGGADSVVLLHLLIQLGYRCIVAHCNFHLRMDEASRDEAFVRKLAINCNLPYYSIDFQTKEYAETHHISIEMAARDLRYAWFENLRITHQAQAIAVAHHADDSIETLLMNLVRGTGLRGLTGISSAHQNVVRPLLCCTRLEIENYISAHHLMHITDSSNACVDYQRNKFRNQVLPLLEEINPSVRQTLYESIDRFKGTLTIYQQAIDSIRKEIVHTQNDSVYINCEKLRHQADVKTVLYELLEAYDFHPSSIKQIAESLDATSGKQFYSPTHRLLKDREYLIVSRINTLSSITYPVHESDREIVSPIHLLISRFSATKDFKVSKERMRIHLDAAQLKFPLQLRHWREGDTFYPYGMTQRKKISDFFIDNKFSLLEKEACWLLVSGESDVVWIVGHRVDNRYSVQEKSTSIVEFQWIG